MALGGCAIEDWGITIAREAGWCGHSLVLPWRPARRANALISGGFSQAALGAGHVTPSHAMRRRGWSLQPTPQVSVDQRLQVENICPVHVYQLVPCIRGKRRWLG